MSTQRTIKFRAWDNRKEVMVPNVTVYPGGDAGIDWDDAKEVYGTESNIPEEQGDEWVFITDCVLMAFTGLTDCKGVEIYESDLVKDHSGDIWEIRWYQEEACFVFQNPYDKRNFNTLTWLFSGEYITLDKNGKPDIEVVGNIFENPKQISTP